MFQTGNGNKKSFLDKNKAARLERERERQQKEDEQAYSTAAVRLQRWWRSRKQSRLWYDVERWRIWDEHSTIENEAAPLPGQVWKCVSLFWILNGDEPPTQLAAQERFQRVCKLILTKMRRAGSQENAKGSIPFHAFLVDSVHSDRAKTIFKRTLDACWRSVTDIQDDLYLTGPELRVLLMYMSPKMYGLSSAEQIMDGYWVMSGYNQKLQEISRDILKSIHPYPLIYTGATHRCSRIIKLREKAAKYSKAVLVDSDRKIVNSILLWLTAVVRCSLFVFDNMVDKGLSQQTAMDDFIVYILAVPCLASIADKPCRDLLTSKGVIQLVTKGRFTRSKTDKLCASLGGEGCLFFVANMMCFYQHYLPQSSTMDSFPQPSDMTGMAINMLEKIKPYVSATQRQGFSSYHPIFSWYSTERKRNASLPNNVYTETMAQLEYIWSRKFMDAVFYEVVTCNELDPSQAGHHASGFKSRFPTPPIRKKSKETNEGAGGSNDLSTIKKPLAELAMDIESAFRLYYVLTELFSEYTKDMWNRVAFTKDLIPHLWKLMKAFRPKGTGLSIYIEDAKRSMDRIENEALLGVLKGFCEGAIILCK
jgi:ubiquitin-protein ligase E3 B